jgi:hypothetical protein
VKKSVVKVVKWIMLKWKIRTCRWGIVLLLGTTLFSTAGSAQNIVDQDLAWLALFGNHRLNERWGLHTEYQLRRHGPVEHWQQSLLRLGVDHYLPTGPILTVGYAWIYTWPYGEQPVAFDFDEHRIWQQLIFNQKAGLFHFNHRYRAEQRFLEQQRIQPDGTSIAKGFIFKQRARYRLMVSYPLMRQTRADGLFFLAAYNEIFVGFGRNIDRNVFEQNRLYGGVGWRYSTNGNVRIGYLNQYIIKSDGSQAERNHTVELAVTYNIDWRKGE